MIQKGKELYLKYKEAIDYLFFGGLATVLNFILAFLFIKSMGMDTSVGNVLDNIICILFAFVTNRIWVFHSRTTGMVAFKEFLSFIGCRIGTMILDTIVMVVGIDHIGLMFPEQYQNIWFFFVKLVAQVLVIVLNYVFSKLFIFKKEN